METAVDLPYSLTGVHQGAQIFLAKLWFKGKFPGRCSLTIFLTDLDGTVTQHDGNCLALDGKSNFDGIFTAVTRHDGKFLALDVFRFLTVSFWR